MWGFRCLIILSFQSKEKTLASTLEISTISLPKYRKESLGGKSWVYKKSTRITQDACTRTSPDEHKPRAQESQAMCIGHVHGNCTQCAQAMYTGIEGDVYVGSNMRKDSLVFLSMFFTTKNWFGNVQILVWALFL